MVLYFVDICCLHASHDKLQAVIQCKLCVVFIPDTSNIPNNSSWNSSTRIRWKDCQNVQVNCISLLAHLSTKWPRWAFVIIQNLASYLSGCWWNLITMFVLMKFQMSSKLGHVGSWTRSPGLKIKKILGIT